MVRFKCTLCGVCCSKYWVPVTHLDIWRIMHYGGYKPRYFLRLYPAAGYKSTMPKVRLKEGEGYIGLRRYVNGLCVFNVDRLCLIHRFKPLTCRFYPFLYVTSGGKVLRVEVNKDAIGVCPGLMLDGKPIDDETYNRIMRLAEVRVFEKRLYADAVDKWFSETGGKYGFEEFIDFMIERAKKDMAMLVYKNLWIK